jgi:hypothetical protein
MNPSSPLRFRYNPYDSSVKHYIFKVDTPDNKPVRLPPHAGKHFLVDVGQPLDLPALPRLGLPVNVRRDNRTNQQLVMDLSIVPVNVREGLVAFRRSSLWLERLQTFLRVGFNVLVTAAWFDRSTSKLQLVLRSKEEVRYVVQRAWFFRWHDDAFNLVSAHKGVAGEGHDTPLYAKE